MGNLQLTGLLQVIEIYDNGSQDHLSCFYIPGSWIRNGCLTIKNEIKSLRFCCESTVNPISPGGGRFYLIFENLRLLWNQTSLRKVIYTKKSRKKYSTRLSKKSEKSFRR